MKTPSPATFENFQEELNFLVRKFSKDISQYKGPDYNEARLRDDFLNPLFAALGWDMSNRASLIQSKREVEIESRTRIGSARKRADYLFRTDGRDRFVCEAKKPREELGKSSIFQAKRYAWNKDLPLAVLTDFEEIKFYVVGARPDSEEPNIGELKTLHFNTYTKNAKFLWEHLSRESIAGGFIDRLIDNLPKKAAGKGRLRQGYLIKPDRNRALDADFLNFLDDARKDLASSLVKHNDHDSQLHDGRLNEATQKILDRILFLRICEDRDIDTGIKLVSIVETWEKHTARPFTPRQSTLLEEPSPKKKTAEESLYRRLVRHFRELDRRPSSHVPFFNGQLFKEHFSETLEVGDDFLRTFIYDLSDENSPYLFNVIPVEILGSVYERFLGKVVRPHGRGVTVEQKPELRKADGIYYTPRYIVNYIVERTVGLLLDEIAKEKVDEGLKAFSSRSQKLRVLDPACGSGSFLIRVFERICEHWERRLTDDMPKDSAERAAWQKKFRKWCWVDSETNDVHLTVDLKRSILTQNIYGVDLDASAVEVTQLSLYLTMLENENRTTLQAQRDLLSEDDEVALLPALQQNIKCGNSLIASDFSVMPEDLVRQRAFDWNIQFSAIAQNGGFDAVIGNPPYVVITPELFDKATIDYLRRYKVAQYKADLFHLFIEKGISLTKPKGLFGMIVPNTWLTLPFTNQLREYVVKNTALSELVVFEHLVFQDANVFTALVFAEKGKASEDHFIKVKRVKANDSTKPLSEIENFETLQSSWSGAPGSVFEVRLTGPEGELVRRILKNYPALEKIARASLGCQAYNSTKHSKDEIKNRVFHSNTQLDKNYLPELAGNDVSRYEITQKRGQWIKYGPWLHDYRTMDWLQGPRILIREISGPKPHSLFAAYVEETFCHYKTILNVNPSPDTTVSMKFLLGVINSRLISFLYPFISSKLVAKAFPRLSVGDIKKLPIAGTDIADATNKKRHDAMVLLVEKITSLTSKFAQATSELERATLQNAISATDQQIDALVYEMYGLTEAEKVLVELGTA